MCRAYAEQLELFGQYEKAASYLLLCHKVDEAIQLLVDHHLFREALAIARSRLAPDDPTPTRIIRKWSRQLTVSGNYELAVEWWVPYFCQFCDTETFFEMCLKKRHLTNRLYYISNLLTRISLKCIK